MVLAVFLAFFGFQFVQPILPLYVRYLGVTEVSAAAAWAGGMMAISPLLAALCAPLWGIVADRYGRKRMVQRSLVGFTIATLLMGLAQTVRQLFLLRAVVGLFGGFSAMVMAYLVTVTPRQRASEAFGLLQAAQVAGAVVGPAAAGLLADRYGLRAPYWLAAGLLLVGFAVVTVVTEDDRQVARESDEAEGPSARRDGASPRQQPGPLWRLLRHPVMPLTLAVLLTSQFIDRSFGPILPLYIADLGTAPQTVASLAGLTTSLGAIATACSAMLVGRLAGRRPLWHLLLPMLVAGLVLSLAMALVQTATQLLALRMLLGLFAGGTLTLGYALANRVIPDERKGAAFGALATVTLFGTASSPVASGLLARVSLRSVFVLDSAIYGLVLVWMWWALRSSHSTPLRERPSAAVGRQ